MSRCPINSATSYSYKCTPPHSSSATAYSSTSLHGYWLYLRQRFENCGGGCFAGCCFCWLLPAAALRVYDLRSYAVCRCVCRRAFTCVYVPGCVYCNLVYVQGVHQVCLCLPQTRVVSERQNPKLQAQARHQAMPGPGTGQARASSFPISYQVSYL